ncbi:D-isomer specific 2-hydroxyacid dehydrogenase family protein [Sinomonas sp. ASV322]|uniref:D-isomer specific 2-hydroxyacid dehydrogenase family protein n=1 Tax=Sinomonas sp. ASV322 TaxID=3041920 RepID=UPI0027DCB00C|nr:D-isomer specific 2-hydroxyacid dehydrogenase family protein [Sinomonas sp. ASV322]MDQ4503461.1 D-isomer specific 2-hydroxyacid dehydrogenase family protein [Sinomonas sp. ASV322]
MTTTPRIAIHGDVLPFLTDAIAAAGGVVVGLGEQPDALVLDHGNDKHALQDILDATPSVRWVQLPSAGIESYTHALAAHPDKVWTSAKGAYAKPVAEHALALTLALYRHLPERAAARAWGRPAGTSLHGLTALVIGAGGIGIELLRLLAAFDMQIDVVRRTDAPVPGARRTTTAEHLPELLPEADVVVVAAALTPGTSKLIGEAELAVMKPGSVLVNIARGGLVDTDALVRALADGRILGAGLDVTDPEPLPDGHPLWDEPRALITPHTADTLEMIRPLLGERVEINVRRFAMGLPLEGLVDPAAGY